MGNIKKDLNLLAKSLKEIHRISPGHLGMILLQAVFVAFSPFVTLYMSAQIINGIANQAEPERLFFYAAVTVTAGLAVHLLSCIFSRMLNRMQHRFWPRWRMAISQKMMSLDYADVESPEIYQLRQTIQDYENTGGEGLGNLLWLFRSMVSDVFTVAFSVSMVAALFTASYQGKEEGISAFAVSPWASALLLAAIGLNGAAGMFFGGKMMKKSHALMGEVIAANRIYGYYLENHVLTYHTGKDIRVYGQKAVVEEEMAEHYQAGKRMVEGQTRNEAGYSAAVSASTVLLSTLVCLFVGLRAYAGMIGIGDVVLYIGSISRFTGGFSGLVMSLTRLRTNNEAMKAYFQLMDLPVRGRQETRKNGTAEIGMTGNNGKNNDMQTKLEVEFRNVSFSYPGTKKWALEHISLKFRSGERLAVVGQNGSGKTTFIKLLCGLYEPEEGSILLNGVDIREYTQEEYRKVFSVVFQDYQLFSFSLDQNVAAGIDPDPDRVAECLRRAGFGERLSGMPLGINTCLYKDFEENGVEISGGEAQKIALARALYKDAPIVVLDEPTAALDPVAEYEIYSRFNEIVGDKAVIYISHRLSSCRFCDHIAVFHRGKLAQWGTHEELAAREEGKYFELWNAQAKHYVE